MKRLIVAPSPARSSARVGIQLLLALLLTLFAAQTMAASEAQVALGDQAVQERVLKLSHQLRCLVCQGQSLAESDSEFSRDMRAKVQALVEQGMNDAEVKDYLVERYGDFILYKPPFKPETYLLWFTPLILFAIGATVLLVNLRRRRQRVVAAGAPLSAEEETRVKKLLEGQAGDNQA